MPQRVLIIGGGFAGLWSAVGAARKLDELGVDPADVEITLVNRDAFHSIRVRNYEADLETVRIPLDDVLEPIGVRRVEGQVVRIDPAARVVVTATAAGPTVLPYDRLVVASGSELSRRPVPGLAEYAFDIDTYDDAARLADHLRALPERGDGPGRFTVVVAGAGLTGIEVACEMPRRLREVAGGAADSVRVVLVDRSDPIGARMGESARPVIGRALEAMGIQTRPGVGVRAVDAAGVTLDSGERIPAATTVWTAGMTASRLAADLPVERDELGRLPVDEFLAVKGCPGVFAAGDVAWLLIDGEHRSVMSCQHSRPMGRYAGHNVICDLYGLAQLPLHIPWYVTVLDLGPWGALYTEGWSRTLTAAGAVAKRTKTVINTERIYPPVDRDRRAILAAGAPVVQAPPPVRD